jgi:hypothetical protein
MTRKGLSGVGSVEDALAAQIRNIEATYGRSMPEWFAVIEASGKTKHTDVVAMLKADHGMSHGAAHRVSLLARQASAQAGAPDASPGADPADALYTGRKAGLRPVHEALMAAITGFGGAVEVAPKKGYLSLRHRKQFAMIQPSAAGRVDVGLILKGEPVSERLESAAGFNALFTHRVRVTGTADVDAQLIGWLKRAYDAAS